MDNQIQFKFRKIDDSQYNGWIEHSGIKVKGIVASGTDIDKIKEELKLLYSVKIEFDRKRNETNSNNFREHIR